MSNGVRITTGSEQDMRQSFLKAWDDAATEKVREVEWDTVLFSDIKTMVNTLTNKRLELLKELQSAGEISVYELARRLRRDYKNIHSDVRILVDVGFIKRTQDGISVKYSKIVAEIDLVA